MKYSIVCALILVSCYDDCPRIYTKNITNYNYHPNKTTLDGYKIDTNNQEVDLEAIDCIIEATNFCFLANKNIKSEFETPDPECLKIVIANDWFHPVNKETGEVLKDIQIFPCNLPGAQGCAGVIQDNQIIIVPPSLDALSHELTHVQTGRNCPFPDKYQPCSDGIRADNCQEFIKERERNEL